MFGELTREKESDGRLDLAGRDGGPLVVVSQPGGFGGNPLEDVIDKRVHDRHGFGRDSSVRMHLFQDLVDVDSVGFLPLLLSSFSRRASTFLFAIRDAYLGFARFLCSFSGGFGRHGVSFVEGLIKLNLGIKFGRTIYMREPAPELAPGALCLLIGCSKDDKKGSTLIGQNNRRLNGSFDHVTNEITRENGEI